MARTSPHDGIATHKHTQTHTFTLGWHGFKTAELATCTSGGAHEGNFLKAPSLYTLAHDDPHESEPKD